MKNKLGLAAALVLLAAVILASTVTGGGSAGAATVTLPGGLPTVSIPTCPPGTHILDLSHPVCVPLPGTTTTPTIPNVPLPNPGGSGSGSGNGGGGGGGGAPSGSTGTGTGTATGTGTSGTTVTVSPGSAKYGAGGGGKTGGVGPGKKNQGAPSKDVKPPPPYKSNGTPTIGNPTTTVASFGPAPIGVPNFVISQFDIPPFLLPIYQACGTEYDIPWQVLAGINKIETAFGTNLNTSTAGAQGWMQFIPSTWAAYGVDANGDGKKDIYNPVDAICAAARYLRASGGNTDIRSAVFSYNHASWYVDEVMLYARTYEGTPANLLGSLTGLTQDDHFPIAANSRYADDLSVRTALHDSTTASKQYGNAANVIQGSPTSRGINIYSRQGAPVVAVNDGVIRRIGHNRKLGNFIVLRDDFGNKFTYAQLGPFARTHPIPKSTAPTKADLAFRKKAGGNGGAKGVSSKPAPAPPAAKGASPAGAAAPSSSQIGSVLKSAFSQIGTTPAPAPAPKPAKANSKRTQSKSKGARAGLGDQINSIVGKKVPGYDTFKGYFSQALGLTRRNAQLVPLGRGSRVSGGTVLARVGPSQGGVAPHINFAIDPTGRGAKKIDPKPILDGWKLLESTAIYRAAGKNPFGHSIDAGGVLLLSKADLERRTLADPRLQIYPCGRNDIRTGQVDRRILAAMEFLASKGFRLRISSLKCGSDQVGNRHVAIQNSGGSGMDISAINGVPVTGHSGPGTLSDAVTSTALQMQGTMRPDEAATTTEKLRKGAPGATKTNAKSKPKPAKNKPASAKAGGAKIKRVSAKTGGANAKPASAKPSSANPPSAQVVHIAFRQLTGNGYYQDPFLDANIVQGGTDQGVNYAGTGPIEAIGNAQVLRTGAPGSGDGVLYKLTDGPKKGKIVYLYDGLTPAVKAGQRVLAGQRVADFAGDGSTDIGFADASGAPLASKSKRQGGVPAAGQQMRTFLDSIQGNNSGLLFTQLLTPGSRAFQIIPPGTTIFEGTRVCNYIVPVLQSARTLGWGGSVLSGYRSYSEQVSIHNSGVFSALPGTSNHEGCRGTTSGPANGAVDVSDYAAFGAAMAQLGYPLRNTLGSVDPGHFSPAGN